MLPRRAAVPLLAAGLVLVAAVFTPASSPAQDEESAIGASLEGLRWGMSPREVTEFFENRIRERFRQQQRDARDAITEDRLRSQQASEVRRLREGYTRFEGQRSGWDVSFLQGEFTHRNRESMLAHHDDEGHQNYYFFIRGRLYKWFRAINDDSIARVPFDRFAMALSHRFGEGAPYTAPYRGGGQRRWMEWQDGTTRLRMVDQRRFYGIYCMVWDELATVGRLDQLRTHRTEERRGHAIVDSVILPDQGEESRDDHADIVDRITGVRVRPSTDDDNLEDIAD